MSSSLKKILFSKLAIIGLCLVSFSQIWAQNDAEMYKQHVKQAEDLYLHQDYKSAAQSYTAAFASLGGKSYKNDRYNAACCWALAGNSDSAFVHLFNLLQKWKYSDYKALSSDNDLKSLHDDIRWMAILGEVEKNGMGSNRTLHNQLDSLVKADQKWRNDYTNFKNGTLKDSTVSLDILGRKMRETDSLHYGIVKNIFEKHGYPDKNLVGDGGAHNFWLLVQHQDEHPEFQEEVLKKMKIAVEKSLASGADYAYLIDRVKVNTGQQQIYGTQMQLNAGKTSYEPKEVIEPKKLNERRASVGLGTIESYIEIMNERYVGSLKK